MTDKYYTTLEKKYESIIETNPTLDRKLVSFQANKNKPVYNWFPYKEGFSVDMVKLFIKEAGKKDGRILDPFSGSGTTLFAASESGVESVGIELLPIGQFILETRKAAEEVNLEKFIEQIKNLKKINFAQLSETERFKHIKITEKAFSANTEKKINCFLTYLGKIKNDEIRQLFKFACFSILEKISYTRKDGQYLRWDARAQKSKTSFDKGKIFAFEEALQDKLRSMANDIQAYRSLFGDKKLKGAIKLETGSSLEILPKMQSNSFDLIISSPPYCNRYDYTRTYALELVFLGVDENKTKELRQKMISCTVENKEKVEQLKEMYSNQKRLEIFNKAEQAFNSTPALQEILQIIERYKKEKKLNNPGIYRMIKNYFYEHSFIIFEMARLLKKGGRIYYVNDNVQYANQTIPVDLILSEFAKKAGLKIKKIYKLQNGKGNSSQQMAKKGRKELRKCVYLWEKVR